MFLKFNIGKNKYRNAIRSYDNHVLFLSIPAFAKIREPCRTEKLIIKRFEYQEIRSSSGPPHISRGFE